MKRDLRIERVYPHPVALVWGALTDPKEIAQWLMPTDFLPIVGHTFTFRTDAAPSFDGIVRCTVLEVVPERRLSYAWRGGTAQRQLVDTVVTFTLAPVAAGTRLVLEHTGFSGIRGFLVSMILGSGWKSSILRTRLPATLQRLAAERSAEP